MSYTILYRAMFVRLSDDSYITIAEMGDNNCYDANRRRSRSWEELRWINKRDEGKARKLSYSEAEVMKNVNDKMQELADRYVNTDNYRGGYYTYDDIYKRMGYFTCASIGSRGTGASSSQAHINFSAKGIKNAVTFEQLAEHGAYIQFGWYEKAPGSSFDSYHSEAAKTEQEAREKFARLMSEGKHVYITLKGYGVERLYNEVFQANKVVRKPVEHTQGYVVCYKYCGGTCTMPKGIRSSLFIYYSLSDHTVFSTEAAALRAMEKLSRYNGVSSPYVVKVQRQNAQSKWELAA